MISPGRVRVGNRYTGWGKSRLVAAVMCLTVVVAACGGGDDDTASATSQSLAISGTPPTQAMQGQQYSFTPTVTPNGTSLMFAITNKPAWATFSTSTGQLSGTPAAAQVGSTQSSIRISVSDGTTTVDLPAFNITIVATATGSATLSWTPPTQNTDGSALTNLAGYKLYWGTSQGSLSNSVTVSNPGLSSYVVSQLTPATWYFALTAVNSAGTESSYSNVATKQVL